MPARRVRLRAVDVTGLEDALEARNAVLLVELRALREIGNAIEVLDLEEIRSALGAAGDDLGRDDLREAPAMSGSRGSASESLPEPGRRRRRDRSATPAGGTRSGCPDRLRRHQTKP